MTSVRRGIRNVCSSAVRWVWLVTSACARSARTAAFRLSDQPMPGAPARPAADANVLTLGIFIRSKARFPSCVSPATAETSRLSGVRSGLIERAQ